MVDNDEIELKFTFEFRNKEEVFFAYHYPYPLGKLEKFLEKVKDTVDTRNKKTLKHNDRLLK